MRSDKLGDGSQRQIMDLIARLEAATGPDRELDALIGVAVQHMQGPGRHGVHPVYKENTARFSDDGEMLGHCPASPYTASIDAALTLVPEGWNWRTDYNRKPTDSVHPCLGMVWLEIGSGRLGFSPVPSIALCIASLKARAELAALTK